MKKKEVSWAKVRTSSVRLDKEKLGSVNLLRSVGGKTVEYQIKFAQIPEALKEVIATGIPNPWHKGKILTPADEGRFLNAINVFFSDENLVLSAFCQQIKAISNTIPTPP